MMLPHVFFFSSSFSKLRTKISIKIKEKRKDDEKLLILVKIQKKKFFFLVHMCLYATFCIGNAAASRQFQVDGTSFCLSAHLLAFCLVDAYLPLIPALLYNYFFVHIYTNTLTHTHTLMQE